MKSLSAILYICSPVIKLLPVLVHKINGLETAGSLSILFSDENGTVKPLTERNFLTAYMNEQSGSSMRLLAVAKCEMYLTQRC